MEILNLDSNPVDISGWFLDDALKTRHIFSPQTVLQSFQYFVIFGGGTPNLSQIAYQLASKGTLGLNNSNEDVFLYDQTGALKDHVHYGAEGGKNQSLVRSPEGTGTAFVLHSSLPEAQGKLFSAGQSVDGRLRYGLGLETEPHDGVGPEEQSQFNTVATPEFPTFVYLMAATAVTVFRYRKKYLMGLKIKISK